MVMSVGTYQGGGGNPPGPQSRATCCPGWVPHSPSLWDSGTAARRSWVVSPRRPPGSADLWPGVMTEGSQARFGSRSRLLSRAQWRWNVGVWAVDRRSWIVSSPFSTCRSSGVSLVMGSPWCRPRQSPRMRSGRWPGCRRKGCECCRALGEISRGSSTKRTGRGQTVWLRLLWRTARLKTAWTGWEGWVGV